MARPLSGSDDSPGTRSVVVRACGALFIVMSTYNPTNWSFIHWFGDRWPEDWLLLLPLVLFYVLAYTLMIRAAYRSLRPTGVGIGIAMMGAIAWVLIDIGLLELNDGRDLLVILLYMAGGLLAVGMSWNALWRRLTGQVAVDDLTA